MDEAENLSHTKWQCKYHVVFIPKCRRKTLYKELRRYLGEVIAQVSRAEAEPDRGGAPDGGSCAHDDLDTAEVRGVAGGGIHQGQECNTSGAGLWRAEANFVGQHFWARGYFVSTVGRDEAVIRAYIRHQEREDERLDQMNLLR
jgi:REP-associated tyrosine transposase